MNEETQQREIQNKIKTASQTKPFLSFLFCFKKIFFVFSTLSYSILSFIDITFSFFHQVGRCIIGTNPGNSGNNSDLYGSTNHCSDCKSQRTSIEERGRLSFRSISTCSYYCGLFSFWPSMVRSR